MAADGPPRLITLLAVTLLALAASALTGCTADSGNGRAKSARASATSAAPDTGGTSPDTGDTAPTPDSAAAVVGAAAGSAVPGADLAAIQAAIASINATAGGPVTAQRAVLDRLAAPDQQAAQQACPAAHSTLAFQPAWAGLRPAPPGWGDADAGHTPSGGPTPPSAGAGDPVTDGTAYLLPAFITIYTGDRISGTDMTTLHLWTLAGAARTAALCVS